MTHPADISDTVLAQRAGKGDMRARREIYSRHIGYLTALCSRYLTGREDVKDALQESFIKIFTSIGSYREREGAALRQWMARIVVNEALAMLRRSSAITFTDISDCDDALYDSGPPDPGLPAEVIFEQIRQLPDGYRTILNLHLIEGLPHREIAAMLGISAGTSASQFSRARALLASRLKKYQSLNPPRL